MTAVRPAAPALAAALALAAAALTGCSSASGASGTPRLSVVHPYIPKPASADMAAGYLTVRNDGDAGDRLVGVDSDLTDDVTMHRTEGGAMGEVAEFPVPAGGELRLDRAGNHLMLEGITEPLAVGEEFRFTLRFATSDPITVEVPVRPMTYRPPEGTPSEGPPREEKE